MISKEELLSDLIVAYRDARKRIRKRSYQLDFEKDLETHLIALRDELWEKRWQPLPADVFIVFRPVQREIFASQFRDRVVHHLLFNYIAPMMDRLFIRDSYSCRKGKGTSDGINRLCHHMRAATDCYQHKAYILKMDIKGYFMSIDKQKLFNIIVRHLDKHWDRPDDREFIDYLLRMVIFNDVTEGCHVRCRKDDWQGLPKSKSLFYAKKGCGLPIGDLTSQLFSNIYMNELDQYVKRVLKCKYYGRYVDDFFIIDKDKDRLTALKEKVIDFLVQEMDVEINDKKTLLQPADWPISFLGRHICPHYTLPAKRTIHHFHQALKREDAKAAGLLKKLPFEGNMDFLTFTHLKDLGIYVTWHQAINGKRLQLERMQSVLNSYLGFMGHSKSFRLRMESKEKKNITKCMDISRDFRKGNLCLWYKYRYIVN